MFRFVILAVLFVAVLGFIAYFLIYFFKEKVEDYDYGHSTEGRMVDRLEYCKEKLAETREEIVSIQENIIELESVERELGKELASDNKLEKLRLLRGFKSELELRKAKVSFYYTCIKKLESLLYNQKLSEELAHKKMQLEKLKENHYEDLAGLEELKSDVETEVLYLDTIEKLSLKMDESFSLDEAKELSLELHEMTKELSDFDGTV